MKPAREHATNNSQTYFVTSDTWERRALFRTETWARLFFKTLLHYRGESYLLHEFVLMPDHFHLLMTPSGALERAVQLIKGGFSHRVKQEFGSNLEIWRRGFGDHRIRDWEDYDKHRHYIHLNPVKKHLCEIAREYRYSSAYPGWKLDPIPRGLKPTYFVDSFSGTAKAVPFQSKDDVVSGTAEQAAEKLGFEVGRGFIPGVKSMESTRPLGPEVCFSPNSTEFPGFSAASEAVPFQSKDNQPVSKGPVAEAVPFQSSDKSAIGDSFDDAAPMRMQTSKGE